MSDCSGIVPCRILISLQPRVSCLFIALPSVTNPADRVRHTPMGSDQRQVPFPATPRTPAGPSVHAEPRKGFAPDVGLLPGFLTHS